MGYAEQLGVSGDEFDDVLEYFERRTHDGREYRPLPNARHGIERGTVLIGGTVVRGYPSVPRTLVLEAGVREYFDGEFVVEEKLNGYNARIAKVGDVLAFTRSGYPCPFTTHLVERSLPLDPFFDDHPDRMLCGEVIGPENPYTTHGYPEVDSVGFRVFDVRDRVTGDPLPVAERRSLCAEYDLPQVASFGSFEPDEAAELLSLVDELDERNREGIVMKSADGTDQLKYTTSAANRDALAYAFGLPFEYGRDFVFSRLLREAFRSVERDESDPEATERARDLGEAILLPMVETIREVQAGETVGEQHTIRGDPDVIEATLAKLAEQGLTIEMERDDTEGDERVVEFVKRSSSTPDKIQYYLEGGTVDE